MTDRRTERRSKSKTGSRSSSSSTITAIATTTTPTISAIEERLKQLEHNEHALTRSLHESIISLTYCVKHGIPPTLEARTISLFKWIWEATVEGGTEFIRRCLGSIMLLGILLGTSVLLYLTIHVYGPWIIDHTGYWLEYIAFAWLNAIYLAAQVVADIVRTIIWAIEAIIFQHINGPPKLTIGLISMRWWNNFWNGLKHAQATCHSVDTWFGSISLVWFFLTSGSLCPFCRFAQDIGSIKWLPVLLYLNHPEFYSPDEYNCQAEKATVCLVYISWNIPFVMFLLMLVIFFFLSFSKPLKPVIHICESVIHATFLVLGDLLIHRQVPTWLKFKVHYYLYRSKIMFGKMGTFFHFKNRALVRHSLY